MRLFRAIMMFFLVATLSLGGVLSHASTSQADHGAAPAEHQDAVHLANAASTHASGHQAAKLGHGDQSSHSEHDDTDCCTVGACSLLLMEAPSSTSSRIVLQIDVATTNDTYILRLSELDSPPPRSIV